MAKRRLTVQQHRRIAEKQRKTVLGLDSDGDVADGGIEGVVITRFGTQAAVLPPDFRPGDRPQRCHIRAALADLVTGDRVIWRPGSPTGVVEARLDRASVISRPDPRGKLRPVAANVDRIAVVIAPEPEPHPNLIDRYLVAAEHEGIRPLLILNKVDLMGPGDSHIDRMLADYRALGYDILRVSAEAGIGLAEMRAYFARHTTVLVGQSGVGKSSLINLLYPEAQALIGELSAQMAKGRHTTTAATLYRLPGGGQLVDSPGIREFGLGHLDSRAIAEGFIEFRPFLGTCRFRDCHHAQEPGCAILDAVARHAISARRFGSYQLMVRGGGEG
ncbi:MAG: small ribosomal subunit biogenesis GTPase RsgA [Porticoccaceae bacterium]|jgi:ribosome biogenesis GTPase|nr:small ribosomal subunit biogenesis GTPase RsgA [Porticoccaceae bacterium]HLS97118.1 small ribosomal subunit biogenesis GTPase RsgA [Porticoccaceae bacterium]